MINRLIFQFDNIYIVYTYRKKILKFDLKVKKKACFIG